MSSVNRDNETYRYILDGLKYANTLYDVRVYLSSKLALGEDKWSAPAINTFRTKPTSEYDDDVVEVVSPRQFMISAFRSGQYQGGCLLVCCATLSGRCLQSS